MPIEYAATRSPALQVDFREHRADPALRRARVAREHLQVVAPGQERVERRPFDHRADARKGGRGSGALAEHGHGAGRRPHETEQHAQRGALPGAVRPQEAVHLAPPHAQVEPIDRDRLAVALAERAGLDHVCHAARR
jgi:hypothetical protein